MIAKIFYASILTGFVYMFASTTQLPRLIYKSFAPAAAQQPATAPAANQQQKIKRAATSEASPTKVNIMPPAPQQVSTPKPQHTYGQLGFMFAMGLLNMFVCYKLFRWVYRVFLKTPIYLIGRVFSFLVIKPYRYLFTPKVIARYDFMYSVPNNTSTERTIIVQ